MLENKTNNSTTKFFGRKKIYIILIILYVALFTFQINLAPLERYPGWDHFWVDTRTIGGLTSLKQALSNFELPNINPYINFGWNFVGNHQSFWGLSNLFVLIFPPDIVIVLNQMLFLILGGIGAYLFLKLLTKDNFISFLGGLNYISIPFVSSFFYYNSASYVFYLFPLFLFLIHKILEKKTIKQFLLFALLSAFAISSGDIYLFLVLPAVILLYSFFIAWHYYHLNFLNSLKKSFILLLLFTLSGSFYIIPLFNNLKSISNALEPIQEANIYIASGGMNLKNFLSFFLHNGADSLLRPFEGSALLLYIPIFFYLAIFIILISAFIFKNCLFKKIPEQTIVIFTLIFLGLIMFLESVVFYSPIFSKIFPNLSENARGVLRLQINLIPFVCLLAGFLSFFVINNLENNKIRKRIYIFIIALSLLIDLFIFVAWPIIRPYPEALGLFNSSNKIHVHFFKDMLHFLLIINILFIILLFSYSFLNKIKTKKIVYTIFISLALILPLLNISVYNEWLPNSRFPLTRDPYRKISYLERKNCIDKIINRYDANYRTLYAGQGKIFSSSGRDWKLIAETEMHVQEREKVLFSYREFIHPYTGLMRGTFTVNGGFNRSNIFPPLSREIPSNIETIKLMGVKYVISTDEKINDPSLIYKGECSSEEGPIGKAGLDEEGGTMFIYELVNPKKIAFLVDDYKKVDLIKSLKTIYENREHPWDHNLVYLETDPNIENKIIDEKKFSDLKTEAEIKKETYNSIKVEITSPIEKYLILSYIYRPYWKVYVNSSETKLYRAYGGFMAVKVPAGQHTIKFKYYPNDVYSGLILTALAFLAPFGIKKIF